MSDMAKLISSCVTSSLKITTMKSAKKAKQPIGFAIYKKPGPKTPPDYISESALKEWPVFYKKHGSKIRGIYNDDLIKKWAVVRIIFRSYLTKINIPFEDPSTSHLDQNVVKSLQDRFYNNRKKLSEKVETVLKHFFKEEVISKVLKERIDEVAYNEGTSSYRMISLIPVRLKKDYNWNEQGLNAVIKAQGFRKNKDIFELTVGTQRVEIIERDDNPDKMYIRTILNFTPQHMKYIFKLTNEDLNNKKQLDKKIKAEFKKLLNKNPLTTIKASVIGFNSVLTEAEYEEIIKLKPKSFKEAVETYTLPHIRSLGSLNYQYNVVRMLLNSFIGESRVPVAWVNISRNPKMYLNTLEESHGC